MLNACVHMNFSVAICAHMHAIITWGAPSTEMITFKVEVQFCRVQSLPTPMDKPHMKSSGQGLHDTCCKLSWDSFRSMSWSLRQYGMMGYGPGLTWINYSKQSCFRRILPSTSRLHILHPCGSFPPESYPCASNAPIGFQTVHHTSQ